MQGSQLIHISKSSPRNGATGKQFPLNLDHDGKISVNMLSAGTGSPIVEMGMSCNWLGLLQHCDIQCISIESTAVLC